MGKHRLPDADMVVRSDFDRGIRHKADFCETVPDLTFSAMKFLQRPTSPLFDHASVDWKKIGKKKGGSPEDSPSVARKLTAEQDESTTMEINCRQSSTTAPDQNHKQNFDPRGKDGEMTITRPPLEVCEDLCRKDCRSESRLRGGTAISIGGLQFLSRVESHDSRESPERRRVESNATKKTISLTETEKSGLISASKNTQELRDHPSPLTALRTADRRPGQDPLRDQERNYSPLKNALQSCDDLFPQCFPAFDESHHNEGCSTTNELESGIEYRPAPKLSFHQPIQNHGDSDSKPRPADQRQRRVHGRSSWRPACHKGRPQQSYIQNHALGVLVPWTEICTTSPSTDFFKNRNTSISYAVAGSAGSTNAQGCEQSPELWEEWPHGAELGTGCCSTEDNLSMSGNSLEQAGDARQRTIQDRTSTVMDDGLTEDEADGGGEGSAVPLDFWRPNRLY
ncbi:MAG: hypothetical protein Q9159_000538 [Coniocarpon cinnabarinum]